MALDASVVIVTYNRERVLERCLDCLFRQDYPKDRYEIILVDDGSTDGTEKMVRGKKPPCRLKYFFHPERLGQSRARNKGIREAESGIIIFIDSDAFAPPWFVKEHIMTHRKNSHLIVDGPAINITGEDNLLNPPFNSLRVKTFAFFDFWGASFITANTSCGRENLIKAGGFDEDFGKGFGWQDQELGLRLRGMGLKRVKNRKAYVLHYQAREDNLPQLTQKRKDRGENAVLYYEKHPLPKIKKEIRFHYLLYDRIFKRLGWTEKYLTLNYLNHYGKKSPLFPLFKKLYLIHIYAEGLKRGIEKYEIEMKID